MKNFLVLLSFVLVGNVVMADTPWIPEHLTNPNYDFKNKKIDCEKEMKNANPFIGATIPEECKPQKTEPTPVQPIQQKNSTKLGKFLDKILEE